jgi:cytidylate kinase
MKELLAFKNSDIAKLVNRQIILSNARVKAMREGEIDQNPYAYRIIAIEHDIGSMAKEVANTLAEEIRWQVFDDKIVHYIAQNGNVREKIVRELDDKSRNLVHDEIERFLQLLMQKDIFGEIEYHQALLKTLINLESHGDAILVGHGCAFAFEDPSRLRIRLTAPPDIRIQRLCKRWEESAGKVQKRMYESDRKIREFVRLHFFKDRDDLSSYDLVFNTGHLSIDKIVKTILAVLRR